MISSPLIVIVGTLPLGLLLRSVTFQLARIEVGESILATDWVEVSKLYKFCWCKRLVNCTLGILYTVVKIPTIPFAVAFLDTWTLPFAVLENAGRHQLAVVHIILPVMTADWCVSAEGGIKEDKKQMNNVILRASCWLRRILTRSPWFQE